MQHVSIDLVKAGLVAVEPIPETKTERVVINPSASEFYPLRWTELGRALKGFIRFQMGHVDTNAWVIPSMGDPSYGVMWDPALQKGVKADLMPTLRGMQFQKRLNTAGQPIPDFGYEFNGERAHQITAGTAALLCAIKEPAGGQGFVVPLQPSTPEKQGNVEYFNHLLRWAAAPPDEAQAIWDEYLATHNGAAQLAFA